MCAPTSTTTSSGSKRSGSRYSSSATTPSKIIRSSVPGRKLHASVTDQVNPPARRAAYPVALARDERVAVADRVRRLPVGQGHQRHQEQRPVRERAALVRDVARRAALTGEYVAHVGEQAVAHLRVRADLLQLLQLAPGAVRREVVVEGPLWHLAVG